MFHLRVVSRPLSRGAESLELTETTENYVWFDFLAKIKPNTRLLWSKQRLISSLRRVDNSSDSILEQSAVKIDQQAQRLVGKPQIR
jgi:hypothetical protein